MGTIVIKMRNGFVEEVYCTSSAFDVAIVEVDDDGNELPEVETPEYQIY